MIAGVQGATLKKVVSPRSNKLAQAEAGCVIPNSGSGSGSCAIPEDVRYALSAELAQMGGGNGPILDCNVCGVPSTPPPSPPPVGSPPTPPPTLGAGVIATHEVSALASQLSETNTVCLEGDICYCHRGTPAMRHGHCVPSRARMRGTASKLRRSLTVRQSKVNGSVNKLCLQKGFFFS
ncbi:hypothetical protein FGO68_gene7605 [Halteria grandinella]|uniref:Uncharacterized protein n=1 Tax=Halteria grandinella TaxID=5974 RepID=A0A8J8NMW8_HALGN|nr:hypothetical protein FGO68_gene7605 [Halteria grandinella]